MADKLKEHFKLKVRIKISLSSDPIPPRPCTYEKHKIKFIIFWSVFLMVICNTFFLRVIYFFLESGCMHAQEPTSFGVGRVGQTGRKRITS